MSGTRVLIVSEDPEIVGRFREIADGRGHDLVVASTAEQVQHAHDSVRVVMTVIDLDGQAVDCLTALRILADRQCQAPVLLVGGCDRRTLRTAHRVGDLRGLSMGAMLNKPLDLARLRRETMSVMPVDRLEITPESIEQALARNEFVLYFQPQVRLATGTCCSAEALVRWEHPEYGFLGPNHFVPQVERFGLVEKLTTWVVRRALQHYANWAREGWQFQVAVNVAAEELRNPGFVDRIMGLLHECGVDARHLILELTESQTISEEVDVLEALTRLRQRNIKLVIDDFGTGYSSLGRLHNLPFTELKIDKSFVMDAAAEGGEDADDAQRLVRLVSELGTSQGMTVIAEGVSSREAWNLVASVGCDIAQGYFISKPLPADAFELWLYENGVETRLSEQPHGLSDIITRGSGPFEELQRQRREREQARTLGPDELGFDGQDAPTDDDARSESADDQPNGHAPVGGQGSDDAGPAPSDTTRLDVHFGTTGEDEPARD